MLTAIIIDDESKGRIALKQKLQDYCPMVEILGEAADGAEGIDLIEKLKPQILFLDIEMPRMDGFEMLKQISVVTGDFDNLAIRIEMETLYHHLAIAPGMLNPAGREAGKIQIVTKDRIRRFELFEL